MTHIEAVMLFVLVSAWITAIAYSHYFSKRLQHLEERFSAMNTAYKSSLKLIMTETERRNEHAKALKRLTDPDSILLDMESGARVREMRDANRTTLPREDAGPPAKVYTPTLRAKVNKSGYKRNQD